MDIGRYSRSAFLTGGLSAAALLLATPASASTVSADPPKEGKKGASSAAAPICWGSGGGVPGNTGNGVTCYQLVPADEATTAAWSQSQAGPCLVDPAGGAVDSDGDDLFEDDWFNEKRTVNLIIGSLTIGGLGPTVGGTGIVGGTGNTAGGTTAAFGGIAAGGTTVGGSGNSGNIGGTTINAPAAADTAAVAGPRPVIVGSGQQCSVGSTGSGQAPTTGLQDQQGATEGEWAILEDNDPTEWEISLPEL
ncbi:hypothetical protein Franean1_3379 [Parafrankia sp. EAN1pec]|nr:hypothetical protein Franean1_3379 [Frankia sp. EAN1pec]